MLKVRVADKGCFECGDIAKQNMANGLVKKRRGGECFRLKCGKVTEVDWIKLNFSKMGMTML